MEDRTRFAAAIQGYLARISAVAAVASRKLEGTLSFTLDSASQDDRDTFEELLEDYLRDEDEFHQLVDDVLDDIASRFRTLADGDVGLGESDWPESWAYRWADRRDFLRRANRFASNQAPQFARCSRRWSKGSGCGPFRPGWASEMPRLVLLDGEGLGHAADAASSLSTRVTRRYQVADAILLVDNAQQPMLSAPNSALRSIVSSGQQSTLVTVFTHFDQMRGPNLPNRNAKEQHILASLDQSIARSARKWDAAWRTR